MTNQLNSSPTPIALGALATYRLTHLLLEDKITAAARDKYHHTVENSRLSSTLKENLHYLSTCFWCSSIYTATAVTLVEDGTINRKTPLKILAYSGVASVIDHVRFRMF